MSLWCFLEEGTRGIEKEVGGRRASGADRRGRAERGNGLERAREAGYPLLQDLMAKNRILIDLCVVMH